MGFECYGDTGPDPCMEIGLGSHLVGQAFDRSRELHSMSEFLVFFIHIRKIPQHIILRLVLHFTKIKNELLNLLFSIGFISCCLKKLLFCTKMRPLSLY